jgi:hypothetical protein
MCDQHRLKWIHIVDRFLDADAQRRFADAAYSLGLAHHAQQLLKQQRASPYDLVDAAAISAEWFRSTAITPAVARAASAGTHRPQLGGT